MSRNNGKFDPKGLKAILTKLEAMKKLRVVVGVPASNNARDSESGISNVTIAAAHEFGVPGHIPERSFLRSTVNENREKAVRFLSTQITQALTNDSDIKRPFELLGANLSGEVVRKIQSGIDPELSEATIKRKGSSKPLIDTGQLVQSITWEVRND